MIVSDAEPATKVPEKVMSESSCARNRGPTPLTRRSPSAFRKGPRLSRSAAIRLAIACVTPGNASICAALATSRSSFPPTYPARSSGAPPFPVAESRAFGDGLCDVLPRRVRTAEPVSWLPATVDRGLFGGRPVRPALRRCPALAAESAACIWCSSPGCASMGRRPVTARATRTPAPSTAMAATKMRARCSGWIVTRATYGPRPAHQHRIVAVCITSLPSRRRLRPTPRVQRPTS
jgi:hypothetical protein